ncbi:MAG: hypothetical protein FWE95_06910 [Planctomycetaceae bacterium]|nr:hypothetical protein [Planctomycetaceae bacterium]
MPERVDQEIEKPLDGCPKCGGPVSECHPVEQFIEEIPPVRPRVVRLITWEGLCPKCGEVHIARPAANRSASFKRPALPRRYSRNDFTASR